MSTPNSPAVPLPTVLYQIIRTHRPDDVARLRWYRHTTSDDTALLDDLAWDAFGMPLAAVLTATPDQLAEDWRASKAAAIRCTARAIRLGWQRPVGAA